MSAPRPGCGISAALLVLLGIGSCGALNSHQARIVSPVGLGLGRILLVGGASGIREGCVVVVRRLGADEARAIRRDGAAALRRVRGVESGGALSRWSRARIGAGMEGVTTSDAPGLETGALAALSCEDGNTILPTAGVPLWMASYNHGEGLIIVDAERQLMWSLYFG